MPSLIAELRSLCPPRPLAPAEARVIAERQAARLLRRLDAVEAPVPSLVIEHLPRVDVHYRGSAALHGSAAWDRGKWRILINRTDTHGRQRFSLAHEFKHVLDAPLAGVLYRDGYQSAHVQAERAADCFAAALLMPRALIKREFYGKDGKGIRDEYALARRFDVSVAAMRVRVDELRLFEPGAVV
jgi:Zn-dependent peptidase ImmA (M78 family)